MPDMIEQKPLSLPQLRVLKRLQKSTGGLTRAKLAEEIGVNETYIRWAVGLTDPAKRVAFEQTKDGGFRKSLFSLGYVTEEKLEVPEDGINEMLVSLTPLGKQVLADLGDLDLPPVRSKS